LKSGYTLDLFLVAGMWVFYNICRVIFFICKAINDSKNSHEFYRFQTAFPLTIKKSYGRVVEISEEWIEYVDYSAEILPKIGEINKILIHLPAKILELEVRIKNISGKILSGEILWNSAKNRDDLAKALYSVDWHYEFKNRNAYFLTPSDFLLKILLFKSPNQRQYEEWHSFTYQGKMALIANFIKEKKRASIILFEEFAEGSNLNGVRISNNFAKEESLKIVKKETLSSLSNENLDGSIVRRYEVSLC